MKRLFHFLFLLSTLPVFAQQITINELYSSATFRPDFMGQIRWMQNGSGYTTLEANPSYSGARNLVLHTTTDTEPTVIVNAGDLIPSGQEKPLSIENYLWSEDGTQLLLFTNSTRVWRFNTKGDYWVFNTQTKKLHQVGANLPSSSLMFAKFSPDGTKVGYVSGHNLYSENIATQKVTQLTSDGTDVIINGTFDWAYEEEFACRDGFSWSPDSKHIAYWHLDASDIPTFHMINYTDSVYSRLIPLQYPKVGGPVSPAKIGVINVESQQNTWMNIDGPIDNQYLPRMTWIDKSNLLIHRLNRKQNHLDLIKANSTNGTCSIIYSEKDEAWVGVKSPIMWLDGRKEFLLLSEKSGWKQIYKINVNGKPEQRITKGGSDIIRLLHYNAKAKMAYVIASPENATQRFLYSVSFKSGDMKRVTPDVYDGVHSYNISPDGKWAIHSFSNINTPSQAQLISLPKHRKSKTLLTNEKLIKTLSELKISAPEFLKLDISEETTLDAYMIKPYDFDQSKKYPVLFYVYGEPASQTVMDRWGGSSYLWHQMIANMGYLVVSVDNRGTPAPKGREWRKCIYGQIGILASADQAAAAQMISKLPYVDANRLGIWGWSGGGAMTLNALFRYPEIYKVGMSVAPVTNQLLYDNIYQERYMGLPDENKEGYFKGSPINFAQNLRGKLLLVHGTGDDNVHYQNTAALIDKLIGLNKQFSMFAYPNRSHGIYEGANTSRHLRTLLRNYLVSNLPAGGR